MTMHRLFDRRSALIAILSGLAAAVHPTHASEAAAGVLAPTGRLRIAVFAGSPISFMEDARTGERRGVSYELGHQLAQRLGIPAELIRCRTVSEVMVLIAAGKADFATTNASPARAREAEFSQPVLQIELGYLVPAASRIGSLPEIDQQGVRIGATDGSSTLRNLPPLLKHAQVVSAPSLAEAVVMLKAGALDAFASNKAILYEMGDSLPAAKVLDGAWGSETIVVAIPKGRPSALPFLNAFLDDAVASGATNGAADKAGLRGFRVVRSTSARTAP